MMLTLKPSRTHALTAAGPQSSDPSTVSTHPTIESTRLLQGCRELLIRHGSEVYRLRHTRNDKLILTK